ncbi:glucose-6-phosphate isomerase [Brevibacillus sp. B_LB10_24]|uniref:glucose-6-phosphate isomerase n=1 Tax=Brevibacillus sp. B_LB10_24 TaxID=3380645 RepID=UPI0038B7EFEB
MSQPIRFDFANARPFVKSHEWEYLGPAVRQVHDMLHRRLGPGNSSLGWLELPLSADPAELVRVKRAAARIRNDSEVFVTIGIGGSCLGAKAAIEALGHTFSNVLPRKLRTSPECYFAGNTLSPVYVSHLFDAIEGKEISINVVSKSGSTIEPAVAFRLFRDYLVRKYGTEGARRRIYVTTDTQSGILRKLADSEGYESFVIPGDIGGRYSVLTAAGLLPIAVSGADVDELLAGAAAACELCQSPELDENPCYQYAAIRNLLYRKGKEIELFVTCEPQFRYFSEWWKQLFGESEGKDGKGIFPASAEFSADLHSLGQYIQDGRRDLFETVLSIATPARDVILKAEPANSDGLNYLAGKGIDYLNKKAQEGTLLAHTDGGVPNLVIEVEAASAYHLGSLFYFFQKACAISGYMMGVNPFDQPGVEAYKANMFALLGKPGSEAQQARLIERLYRSR